MAAPFICTLSKTELIPSLISFLVFSNFFDINEFYCFNNGGKCGRLPRKIDLYLR
jgi:hypothetical protein